MTTTGESTLTPPEVKPTGEAGKKIRKPLGALRVLLFVWASAAICAFAIGQSGLLDEPPESDVLNVNKASVLQLKDLPSINEKIAKAIIGARPFKSVEDLLKVKGIGEKKLEKLRPFIRVE